jgi:hypothetical protein
MWWKGSRLMVLCALMIGAWSCSGDGKTVAEGGDTLFAKPDGGTVLADSVDPNRPEEDIQFPDQKSFPDQPFQVDLIAPAGGLGAPCEDNGDCDSGFCVPSDIGDICTSVCIDDCPEDWVCKGVPFTNPDVIFVCMPNLEMVCEVNGVCESGQIEDEVCGNCGERTRTCKENCQWGAWSNCFGEGECVATSHEEELCGKCGLRSRDCTDQCAWSDWTECAGQGECVAGDQETQPCGICGLSQRTCTDACLWSDWGSCEDAGQCEPGSSEEEECGMCGTHMHICTDQCLWSEWGECSNEGTCSSGELKTQDCGNCGTQEQTCTDGCEWSAWGACESEGECSPDDEEDEACGQCGIRVRKCAQTCDWGQWGNCIESGQCSPGEKETEPCGDCGTRERTCTNSCQWSNWGSCQGEGPCSPGEKDSDPCGNCGTKSRTCNNFCDWGSFGSCINQGVCSPGSKTGCNLCGTQTCNNSCSWGSCALGNVDGYEQNDSSWAAYTIPGITDQNGSDASITANINPSGDDDYFKIHIEDKSFAAIDPKFTLTVPSGQTYKLCVTYDCDENSKSYSGCKTITSSGNVSLDVGGCENVFQGDNDSGTAAIKVEPLSSGSCANYTLKVEA